MYSYSFSQWVIFFLCYCLIGWCIESTFVSCRKRQLVNRGFLNGPVIPIYGFGAIAILFATLPVREHLVAVFFLGMLAATVLEFVTGAVMESLFQVRYWDYSDNPLNLKGYICLSTSLAWGVLSVVLIRWLHGPVESLVLSLSQGVTRMAAGLLGLLFVADFAVSLKTALDLRRMLEQLRAYSERAWEDARLLQKRMEVYAAFKKEDLADFLAQKLPDGGEGLQRHIDALEQMADRLEQSESVQRLRSDLAEWKARRAAAREKFRLSWDKQLLLRGNPTARSKQYADQLQLLRQRLAEDRQERRERQKKQ